MNKQFVLLCYVSLTMDSSSGSLDSKSKTKTDEEINKSESTTTSLTDDINDTSSPDAEFAVFQTNKCLAQALAVYRSKNILK